MQNIPTNEPCDVQPPDFPENGGDYVVMGLDIGNGQYGKMALSYLDGEHGGYGVGTRQVLSMDPALSTDCTAALNTFRGLVARRDIRIDFELNDPCVKPPKGILAIVKEFL